jgi:hypothetical protein
MVSKCGDIYHGKRKSVVFNWEKNPNQLKQMLLTLNGWRRMPWLNLGFLIQ